MKVGSSDKSHRVYLNGYESGRTDEVLILGSSGYCLVGVDSPDVGDGFVCVRDTTPDNPVEVCLQFKEQKDDL